MAGRELAYQFVPSMYELLNTRYNEANSRLHAFVALSAGFTVAASTLIGGRN